MESAEAESCAGPLGGNGILSMKPENALMLGVSANLSPLALEDALIKLECYPIIKLIVGKQQVKWAQRVVSSLTPSVEEDFPVIVPCVILEVNEDYKDSEWSVEHNGRVFWSPGV